MTTTQMGNLAGVRLGPDQLDYLMRDAGITSEVDRQMVKSTIKAITEAAAQEAAMFPDAELTLAVNLTTLETWRWGDEGTPSMLITDLESVMNVMNSKLLIGAVRRRKSRSMSEPAINATNRFISGVRRLF